MKTLLSLGLALVLCLSLAACGGAPSSAPASTAPSVATPSQPSSTASSAPTGGDIEVDKGLLDVTITIPANFFEFLSTDEQPYTAESWAASATDPRIKKAQVNEDGSASFTISKSDHKLMMQEMHDSIANSIESLKESYPSVRGLEVNNDCTEITLIVDKAGYEGSFDAFAVFSLELQGAMYQAFNGTSESEVIVNVKDEASGEIFDSSSTKDIGK